MTYKAKYAYSSRDVADNYEDYRFKNWHGRVVNWLEKKCMADGLNLLIPRSTNCFVLDAPSGTGRLSSALIEYGYRIVSVDISLEMLKKSREVYNLNELPQFLGYVVCDIEHLPFKDKSIDAVASLRIMGHLPYEVKDRVLSEFNRVSRFGAVIMFALDNLLLRCKRWLLKLIKLKPKSDMWFPISHNRIMNLALKNGFGVFFWRDLCHWISESRVYVLHTNDNDL